VDEAVELLIGFLDFSDYIRAETCVACKNLLRKYPDKSDEILPKLRRSLSSIEEPEGKASAIWMIGEYGDTIDDAPYTLETIIDNYTEETSSEV